MQISQKFERVCDRCVLGYTGEVRRANETEEREMRDGEADNGEDSADDDDDGKGIVSSSFAPSSIFRFGK
jgi:hypothetical protein